jgi:hypothetical protein
MGLIERWIEDPGGGAFDQRKCTFRKAGEPLE